MRSVGSNARLHNISSCKITHGESDVHKMSTNALILVAAGRGERAGGGIPKQYRSVAGRPLIAHTLENLTQSMDFDHVVIVTAKNDGRIMDVISNFNLPLIMAVGGETRTDSVRSGLLALTGLGVDHAYIHDAARPFVSNAMMDALQAALLENQAAAPSLKVPDAVKTLSGDSVDRDAIVRVQTPQAFRYDDICAAFNNLDAGQSFADDIAVARHAGLSIAFTHGSDDNFKVTYPEDFAKAERMIKQTDNTPTYTACGQGFDVHRFEPGPSLWLCGVEILAGMSLKGHSDADVGLHALTDAILGAICFGDIGDHFPPSDPKWAGVSSDQFLKFAAGKVQERGGRIMHVDVTLICEKPKIKPHRAAMKARIAEILSMPESRVSVKATTTEKLGFTGRGEGIAAQASASVRLPDV